MAKQAFFLGIKGVGMTSLALALQEDGWEIKGSDTNEEFITDSVLQQHGIYPTDLTAPLPDQLDLIVYSSAYTPPATQVPVKNLATALADLVSSRRVIAVAGVGGKTTTTAMLAALFHRAGRDVGYYVGTSTIAGLNSPGHLGTDPYFVVEADEYAISKTDSHPKFSLLSPEILITTNILHDHPDIYKDVAATRTAFTNLIASLPAHGTWIYYDQDPLTQTILKNLKPTIRLRPYHTPTDLELNVFGIQNQRNAQAAITAATLAGVTPTLATTAIQAYRGSGRRQEFKGEHASRLLFDDYGHHPSEIKVTLESFRARYPDRRIILVFESHTFSRTKMLLQEFAAALALADLTFIMPIFASAREKTQNHHISNQSLAELIPNSVAVTWENAPAQIWQASKPHDIILTMGAGFVYKIHESFKKLG